MDKWSGGVRGDPRRDAANNPDGQHAYPVPNDEDARAIYEQELNQPVAGQKQSVVVRLKRWVMARF